MTTLQWNMQGSNRLVLGRNNSPIIAVNSSDWIIEDVEKVSTQHWIAWDNFRERGRRRFGATTAVSLAENHWTLLDESSRALASISLELPHPWHAILHLHIHRGNRAGLVWWGPQDERLYGFGEYGDGPLMSPGRWSTWTEEGPVGLGPLGRWLRWTGKVPLPGHRATYAPSPTWLSSLGYAAWLDETERVDWTYRGSRRSLRVWDQDVTLHVVAGDCLKDALIHRNQLIGLPRLPALWQFGPWNDAVQGESQVRMCMLRLRENQIPSSAMWIEDWTGSWEDGRRFWMRPLSHKLSRRLYPHWEDMVSDLHQMNFKVLGYFCPEIAQDTRLYQEALAGGHLVQDSDGRAVDVDILGHHHGEIDLTRSDTREWVKSRLFAPALEMGFDGWMADFGEHLPVESLLDDGTSGFESHNRWPLLWQSLNREFWQDARPDGDYTFFVRSAGLTTPSLAPAMWGGDSDTDWDVADGLPTVVPAALSAGLSGNVFWGTDIAGYMSFGLTRPSTKELYIRWAEVGALMPLMRTHHGTARPRNWHWSRDEETQTAYARLARLHASLLPVFYNLADEASKTGLPVIRPLWLEYPDADPADNRQFLIGSNLLCAPVVRRGQRRQMVDLPTGAWNMWWTSVTYHGPARVVVDAPLGQPPLFWRQDAWLALSEGLPAKDTSTLGFVESLAHTEGQRAASFAVTLVAPKTSAPVTLTLPGGILTGRPELGCDADENAPPPTFTSHLPPLSEGVRGKVPPWGERKVAQMQWEWSGREPLWVTVRRPEPQ